MKTRSFAALLLLVAGCSGSTTHDPDNTNNPSELERKRLAAESIANGSSMGDPCAANGWYGDGVCDSFCSGAGDATDTDCVPPEPGGSEPVVCAQFLESSDLECTRSSDDPCLFQDPDCDYPGDPCISQDPDCVVVCAAYIEESDGVCSRDANDPCRSQDPDCDVACAEYIEEPDGECTRPSTDPCMFQDPDCNK